jgi:hypothetical protein
MPRRLVLTGFPFSRGGGATFDERSVPLGEGGTSGGFWRNPQPGVGCRSGTRCRERGNRPRLPDYRTHELSRPRGKLARPSLVKHNARCHSAASPGPRNAILMPLAPPTGRGKFFAVARRPAQCGSYWVSADFLEFVMSDLVFPDWPCCSPAGQEGNWDPDVAAQALERALRR